MVTYNIYLIIILAILIGTYLLELLVEFLNIKRLSPELPEEFEGFYDAEEYAKSQRYTRERTRFGLIDSTFSTAILVAFILVAGFNWVDQLARSFEWGSIPTGLVFFGILILASKLLNLPFSLYSTFVIEEKYGFNRTTLKTYTLDFLKNLLLLVIFGGLILALIIWFFSKAGDFAWLYVWGVLTLFLIFFSAIFPAVIMPLFNKFTPLGEDELAETIETYAREHDFKMRGIYSVDGSRRSTRSNAFFAGFGRSRRIGLFDTLINNHNVKEILGIFAHEVGHYKLGHIPKGIIAGILNTGLMLYILSLFINNEDLFAAFGVEKMSIYASLLFFSILFSPISILVGMILKMVSRAHEYQADTFAVRTTGDADNFVNALKKLSVNNLSNLTPHPLKVFLEYRHPTVLERIRAIKQTKSDDSP